MNRLLAAIAIGVALMAAGCGGESPSASGTPFIFFSVSSGSSAAVVRMNNISGAGKVGFGSLGSGYGQFNTPAEIAVDSLGRIYAADTGNNRIIRMDDMQGDGFVACTGGKGSGDTFSGPTGVYVDHNGNILVVDSGNSRIVEMSDIFGDGFTAFGASGSAGDEFTTPNAITEDGAGRIYITDSGDSRIVRINNISGAGWVAYGTASSQQNSGPGTFSSPLGIAVTPTGQILVADSGDGRVVEMNDMTGAGWTTLSVLGGTKTSPIAFTDPSGVGFDPSGGIYVADQSNLGIVWVNNIKGFSHYVSYTVGNGFPIDVVVGN